MSETERSNNSQDISNNQYYTSATALQIRLNVEPLLVKLELDLRGLEESYDEESGKIVLIQTGEKLMNELGIKNFLSFVRSVINVQVVQGNLSEDSYANYLYKIHVSIAKNLIINRHRYDLSLDNYNGLVDRAMLTVIGFLTRPIGDKERNSYANTLKHIESSQTVAQKSNGIFRI